MKKYKLINKQTGEEYLCDKVTIDGFDYYVSDVLTKCEAVYAYNHIFKSIQNCESTGYKKVIATNNPNIDIPKVVDEVEKLAEEYSEDLSSAEINDAIIFGFKAGHNKSQETHPFSEEDLKFVIKESLYYWNKNACSEKEAIDNILQFWKEQQPKTLYYE